MATKNQGTAPIAIGLVRYVHMGFFAAWLVLTYVLMKLITAVWTYVMATNDLLIATIAIVIAGGGTVYAYKHKRLNQLSKEVATELSKVTWPTRKETSAFTVTVIITSIIAALILGLYDMLWSAITNLVYQ